MSVRSRVRSLMGVVRDRDRFEAEMEEEFAAHLEMRAADLVKQGMQPAEAMRQARLEFGSVESYKEEGRESRGLRVLEEARGDLGYALRMLRRNPGYAVVAVVTFALGVGANTAIFGLAERVLVRPIEAPALDRLYVVRGDIPELDLEDTQLSPVEVMELRESERFDGVAGYSMSDRTITLADAEPMRAKAAATLGDFDRLLGVRPMLGRMYSPDQSESGPTAVVVVSHELWQQLGGGDPSFVGRRIELNDVSHEVIGVMPPGFDYPRRAQMWLPFEYDARWREPDRRGSLFITTLARRHSGTSPEHLQAQLDAQEDIWREQLGWTSERNGRELNATPLVEYLAGPLRIVMFVLLGAVAFVMLIAAANLGSLQLVRTIGRAREIAVRRALGASRGRVARQLLIEGAVVGAVGAVAGLAIGALILRVLHAWEPARQMNLAGAGLDGRVMLASLAMALLTTLAFSLVPALRGARIEPASMLRQSQPGANIGPQRHRLLNAALVAQVALALVLLLGSLLMVRTLRELVAGDPGFDAEGLVTAQVSIPAARYDSAPKSLAFFDALLARVRSLPGVDDAALVWGLPFTDQNSSSPFDIIGQPRAPGDPERHAEARMVSPGYFATMGIPLLRGSDFDGTEGPGTPIVAVIDRTFAEQYFPGENPVGRRINGFFGDETTIIGVAERVDHDEIGDAPKAAAYYSYRHQHWSGWRSIVVRTSRSEAEIAAALRNVVAELDPAVPLYDVRTMPARIETSLGPRRLATVTLAGFALLAVLLAAFGVYGVMRYTTDLRRQEIGVRLAVGAEPKRVVGLVVRRGVAIGVLGVTLGVFAAIVLTRFMSALLYGVRPQDPAAFVLGAAVLIVAAALASWLPARRAARLDPIMVLRSD